MHWYVILLMLRLFLQTALNVDAGFVPAMPVATTVVAIPTCTLPEELWTEYRVFVETGVAVLAFDSDPKSKEVIPPDELQLLEANYMPTYTCRGRNAVLQLTDAASAQGIPVLVIKDGVLTIYRYQ